MAAIKAGETVPANAECYGCGSRENIVSRNKDEDGCTYFLCDNCEEECRVMLDDFVKHELGV